MEEQRPSDGLLAVVICIPCRGHTCRASVVNERRRWANSRDCSVCDGSPSTLGLLPRNQDWDRRTAVAVGSMGSGNEPKTDSAGNCQ